MNPSRSNQGQMNGRLWLSCFVAEALLFGLAFAAVYSHDLLPASPVSKPAVIAPKSPAAMTQDLMPDAPMRFDLHRFALNALLVP